MRIDNISKTEDEVTIDVKITDRKVLSYKFNIDKENQTLTLHGAPILSGYGNDIFTVEPDIENVAREMVEEAIQNESQFESYEIR